MIVDDVGDAARAANEAHDAANEAVELAEEAIIAADEVIGTEQALEAAVERIDEVQEGAAAIAEAAMRTEIGQRVTRLETEWHRVEEAERDRTANITTLTTSLAELRGTVETLMARLPPNLIPPSQSTEPDTSSLTLPSSPPVNLEEVTPEPEIAPAVVESPARRKIRRL